MARNQLNLPFLRPFRLTRKSLIALLFCSLLTGLLNSGCRGTLEIFQVETQTPEPSPAATQQPPPTPIPPSTPVPTLPPQARIAEAEKALFYGDYDSAMRQFIIALETNPGPDIEAAARLGIGRVQWLTGESSNALLSLRDLVAAFPESPQSGDAQIYLGFIFNDLQRYGEAAGAFQAYMDRHPGILDAYAFVWKGDALRAAGRPEEAVAAYTAALNSPRLPGDDQNIQIKIAGTLADAGELETALAIYTELSLTANESLKPTLLLLRGGLLEKLGQPETAYGLYAEAAENYPRAYDSYTALLRMLDAGVQVNELHRGLIDYFVGEYSLAVFAFDRYLAVAPPEVDGAALYYKGLSLRAIDSYDLAIDAWTTLIQTKTSADPYWDDAWEEIGDTEWAYFGDYEAAIETFESFTARVPEHPRAAEFLFFAAQIAERNGELDLAVQYWERLTNEYPTHFQVARSRFLAGIAQYRLKRYSEALAHFRTIQSFTSAPFEASQALFWIGKAQMALGNIPEATLSFEQAASIDPTGYYSERAQDIVTGKAPFAAPANFFMDIDWESERQLAEGWLRSTFSLPDDLNLASPGPLYGDIRFVRGTALWNLGFYEQARAEFESLRLAMESDPANNFRLANYTLDLGLYRTAIFSARQVLNLAGMDDAGTVYAPPWFNYIRFGTYFSDLVLPAAEEKRLHPLLIWSVIRQESLYEGFVRSSAGARGLMQIIPSTGAGIHQSLGWPETYSADDLYRPYVNIRFGVDYLADQIEFFSGGESIEPIDLYAALAAYNGGPGNSAAWLVHAQGDPDLFLEIIRFNETQRYIRGIFEIYTLYLGRYDRSR